MRRLGGWSAGLAILLIGHCADGPTRQLVNWKVQATVIPLLSPRERVVLMMLVDAHDKDRIAELLYWSPHTAKNYMTAIYRHFGVSSNWSSAIVSAWATAARDAILKSAFVSGGASGCTRQELGNSGCPLAKRGQPRSPESRQREAVS